VWYGIRFWGPVLAPLPASEVGQPRGNHSGFRKRDGQRQVRWEGMDPIVSRYECAAGGFMWTGIDHLGKVRVDRNMNVALGDILPVFGVVIVMRAHRIALRLHANHFAAGTRDYTDERP
jgi:hypothetical protein